MTRTLRLAFFTTLALACAHVSQAAEPSAAKIPYPDNAPGRHAAAFFPAYNAGEEDAMRRFYETHVSAEGLKRRPVTERLSVIREMRERQGRLTPLEVRNVTETSVEVIVLNQIGDRVSFTFLCEDDPPRALMGIRVEDLPQEGDEEAGSEAGVTGARMADAEVVGALRAHLESLHKEDQFSGVVLLARGTIPLFREAYGYASRPDKVPNRPDTKFNLGSINKAFTRLAIEQLAKEGKLKPTGTIDRFVPEYPAEKGRRITIAQLLEHKGGVPDIFGPKYQAADRSKLRELRDWVPLFRDEPLHFDPGTRQEYSNGGYVLLGRVIETASGRNYYDYIREKIYAPAGMKDTDSYFRDQPVANRAIGYTRRLGEGSDVSWRDATGDHGARGSSAGGGYSTVDDLLRFAIALRDGRFGSENRGGGMGIAGGSPGTNAVLEMVGDYTVVVLANVDPPAAERVASKVRGWLRQGGSRSADDPGRKPKGTYIPESGVDVPMLKSGHLPAVQVMVNGQGPFLFGIDTGGAGVARVTSALTAKLALPTIGEVLAGDPSGKDPETRPLVALDSIEVGGAKFTGLTASVRLDSKIPRDETVDGILGFGLFADCLFTLDYPAARVQLAKGELPPPNGKDVLEYRDRHGIPSVKLGVGDLELDADVDAGATGGFILPESVAAKLKLASQPKVVGHARTVSNEFEIKAAELDGEIALGRYTFAKPTVEFQPVFSMANVGARVLRDFRVTFDQNGRRLKLERPGGK